MSIFNELLPKINEISKAYIKNFNDDLKVIYECFDKFEEEFQNGRSRTREKAQKDKLAMTTLQSINEDDDEPKKPESDQSSKSDRSSMGSNYGRRASKKRSKNEVEGILSPEQDKRQKRNASIKAQSVISKQVNVNLTQKLRRENSIDKVDKSTNQQKGRRNKDDDKENSEPNEILPVLQIKLEKISIPPEPMDTESLPVNIEVKQEPNKDDIAMPPPTAPVPKPRKALQKNKSDDKESDEESSSKTRSTRNRKQTDAMPPPPNVPSARSTRSSSRATRQTVNEEQQATEARPKRTRAKKKASETTSNDSEKDSTQSSQESVTAVASPAEKPRPKRTRRGQKATEISEPPKQPEIPITPKEERICAQEVHSPILQKEIKIPKPAKKGLQTKEIEASLQVDESTDVKNLDKVDMAMDETRIINKVNDMDQTVVLPNGVYNHAPVTPTVVRNVNETIVVQCNRETIVIEKANNVVMDATVVIDKGPKETNMTDDNSLITDDSDSQEMYTPPKSQIPVAQPTSAVKEKVQQFEELASRVTRTKTRAMAKKEEQPTEEDTQTPPDKISKPVLSAETLKKMNNLIFNGKPTQVSSSATKPRAIPVSSTKTQVPSSTSKLTARTTDVDDKIKDDPRLKKEAMLEAKRELQRRKREEKMAAAAAAREAAERERAAAAESAARDKRDKLAQLHAGKVARLKEVERKKQEYARKVAITEERRRAEEAARLQRLEDEQKRAEAQRRKQIEEQLQMKKEEAIMAKEIEKRQKEYIEKQKMKQRMEEKMHTPLRTPGTPGFHVQLEPVYMADGFQYLNSDEDEEPPPRPVPEWSTSKARKLQLDIQSQVSTVHIDRLFGVGVQSPDLRAIFPSIDRSRLKRTSSAVWRTPPGALPPRGQH